MTHEGVWCAGFGPRVPKAGAPLPFRGCQPGHASVQRVHANSAGRGPGQAGVGTSAVAAVRDGKGSFLCSPFSRDTSLEVPRGPCVTLAPLRAPVA